jgi:hypothetical protein
MPWAQYDYGEPPSSPAAFQAKTGIPCRIIFDGARAARRNDCGCVWACTRRYCRPDATPALDGIKRSEEPQLPAASAPARDKKVRNKKRSRRRQDDTRSAYASHSGGHYDYGRRNDYSARYDSVPRYLQEGRPIPAAGRGDVGYCDETKFCGHRQGIERP